MNPRERFRKAINHEQPDRPPIDLGQYTSYFGDRTLTTPPVIDSLSPTS